MGNEEHIRELAQQWVSKLNGKEFNSTSEEMCFQSYAYEDGYKQCYQDLTEKACETFAEILVELCPDLLGYGGIAKAWENDFRERLGK